MTLQEMIVEKRDQIARASATLHILQRIAIRRERETLEAAQEATRRSRNAQLQDKWSLLRPPAPANLFKWPHITERKTNMAKSLITIAVTSSDADEIIRSLQSTAEHLSRLVTESAKKREIETRYLANQIAEQVKAQR